MERDKVNRLRMKITWGFFKSNGEMMMIILYDKCWSCFASKSWWIWGGNESCPYFLDNFLLLLIELLVLVVPSFSSFVHFLQVSLSIDIFVKYVQFYFIYWMEFEVHIWQIAWESWSTWKLFASLAYGTCSTQKRGVRFHGIRSCLRCIKVSMLWKQTSFSMVLWS